MSILAQCPICKRKQSIKNKKCKCSENLEKAKRSKKVKYWVNYRLPDGTQRREPVKGEGLTPYSIEDARKYDAKRKIQKAENRILDIKQDSTLTFNELTEWYLGLEKVKSKAYFPTIKYNLASFNAVFGQHILLTIKPADLENYQEMRKKDGYSDSYVDQQIGAARTMVNKAFDNDMLGGDALRVFKKVGKLLKRNSNARDKIITHKEFLSISENLPRHTKAIFQTGYYAGMRKGEILNLTWDKVNMKNRFIYLEAEDTKDKEKRSIPICDELHEILTCIPPNVHNKHVFTYKGFPIKDIRTALKKACEKAGVPYGRSVKGGFTFHDLRHTFNTFLRKKGEPESVIMAITGHSTREMFDRYNTVDDEDKKKAVDQLGGFLAFVDQDVDQSEKNGEEG